MRETLMPISGTEQLFRRTEKENSEQIYGKVMSTISTKKKINYKSFISNNDAEFLENGNKIWCDISILLMNVFVQSHPCGKTREN